MPSKPRKARQKARQREDAHRAQVQEERGLGDAKALLALNKAWRRSFRRRAGASFAMISQRNWRRMWMGGLWWDGQPTHFIRERPSEAASVPKPLP